LESIDYYHASNEGYGNLEKLSDFHRSLYENQQTQLAITSMKSVYKRLRNDGVLVYRLTPSYMSIKSTIRLLSERVRMTQFENRQLAVIGCKMLNEMESDERYELFKWKYHELNFKKTVLKLTEKLNGSFVDAGEGLFLIYTTRGEIDHTAEYDLFEVMNEYKAREALSIGVVVGYGENVSQAEQNVRYGLNQCHHDEEASILIIDEQYHISTRYPKHVSGSLDTESMERELLLKFGERIAGHRDIIRIITYSHKYNKKEFTSQDISRWLNSTERNGRRILAELEGLGVIEKCGKVSSSQPGRPKHIYCFTERLSRSV